MRYWIGSVFALHNLLKASPGRNLAGSLEGKDNGRRSGFGQEGRERLESAISTQFRGNVEIDGISPGGVIL